MRFLSPYAEPVYRELAVSHASVIGLHPESFPDTHGSPAMGMEYTTPHWPLTSIPRGRLRGTMSGR